MFWKPDPLEPDLSKVRDVAKKDIGEREARKAAVELIMHGRDGSIRSKDSYAVEHRVIKESAGTPSVSRARIAAAARDVVRAGSSAKRRVG